MQIRIIVKLAGCRYNSVLFSELAFGSLCESSTVLVRTKDDVRQCSSMRAENVGSRCRDRPKDFAKRIIVLPSLDRTTVEEQGFAGAFFAEGKV